MDIETTEDKTEEPKGERVYSGVVPTEPGFYPVHRDYDLQIGEDGGVQQCNIIGLLTGEPPCMDLTLLAVCKKERRGTYSVVHGYVPTVGLHFGEKIDPSIIFKAKD